MTPVSEMQLASELAGSSQMMHLLDFGEIERKLEAVRARAEVALE